MAGKTKSQIVKEIKGDQAMVSFCKSNFYKITCYECEFHSKCKEFFFIDNLGYRNTIYPLDY